MEDLLKDKSELEIKSEKLLFKINLLCGLTIILSILKLTVLHNVFVSALIVISLIIVLYLAYMRNKVCRKLTSIGEKLIEMKVNKNKGVD